MRTYLLPALAAGLLTLAACDIEDFHGAGRFNRDFHYNYPLAADGKLSVETFNGTVEVSGWDQDAVDISGTKYARTQEFADDLQVSVDHSPNAVSIRAEHPSMGRNNEGVRFVIRIPRAAVIDRITSSNGTIHVIDGSGPTRLKTSNGTIRVQGLKGGLDAQTSNGTIHAELAVAGGPVRVETSNGSVELNLPAHFDDSVRVHTSNGGITLRMPTDVNARVTARTSNGKISSDVDMRMGGEFSKNRLDGIIGAGGPLIDLSTSNGGIRITR
jgi:hypothetical protein